MRWAQIHEREDGREVAHWIFEADAPPVCHPSIKFEAVGPDVREGATRPVGSSEWESPPVAMPSRQTVRLAPADLAAREARQVEAMTTEELGFFGNIWVRAHRFAQVGEVMPGHTHRFDHVSFLTRGRVRVEVGEHATDYTAPAWIVVRKEHVHRLICLEAPADWWCVFAVREPDGSIAETFDPARHDPMWFST